MLFGALASANTAFRNDVMFPGPVVGQSSTDSSAPFVNSSSTAPASFPDTAMASAPAVAADNAASGAGGAAASAAASANGAHLIGDLGPFLEISGMCAPLLQVSFATTRAESLIENPQ